MSLAPLSIRLTHTGVYADGRTNTSSVLITDLDTGLENQTRKVPVYVPAGGYIDIPLSSRSLLSMYDGAIAGFVGEGLITAAMALTLRDASDQGGGAGTGVSLLAGQSNVRRNANVLSFVVAAADAPGFVVGEALRVSGLTGDFSSVNGTYIISAVAKGEDLAGANGLAFLISVASTGSNIAAAENTATLTLPDGKVRVILAGSGNAGGLGADVVAYLGGDVFVSGTLDPKAIQVTPTSADEVPVTSFYAGDVDGLPYFKDAAGTSHSLSGGGGGGGNTIRNGAGAPGAGLGIDGDFYIDTAADSIYGPKTGGAWGSPTSLVGPAGVDGDAGADGKTILNGPGAPENGVGVDGDFYIDTDGPALYGPKAGGVWGAATAIGGPGGGTIWVANSSQASSTYGNGLRYVPLRNAADDYVEFQLAPAFTGTMVVQVLYAMSASEASGVVLRLDRLTLAVGANPTTAVTSGTQFTVTPGNDVLIHSVSGTESADFSFAVTAGQVVYCKLTRLGSDGADTHSGDLRVIEIRVR